MSGRPKAAAGPQTGQRAGPAGRPGRRPGRAAEPPRAKRGPAGRICGLQRWERINYDGILGPAGRKPRTAGHAASAGRRAAGGGAASLRGDYYGGYWEVTTGSALAGEDSCTAAVRELYEETGIRAEKEELILFDHVITPRIFSDTYLLRLAEEPKIALQSTETVDYAWLTPAELLERCREGMVIGHLAERFARYAVMLEDVLQKEGEK